MDHLYYSDIRINLHVIMFLKIQACLLIIFHAHSYNRYSQGTQIKFHERWGLARCQWLVW